MPVFWPSKRSRRKRTGFINLCVTRVWSTPCKASQGKFNLCMQPVHAFSRCQPESKLYNTSPSSQQLAKFIMETGRSQNLSKFSSPTQGGSSSVSTAVVGHLSDLSTFLLQTESFRVIWTMTSVTPGLGGMGNVSKPIQYRMRGSLAEQERAGFVFQSRPVLTVWP